MTSPAFPTHTKNQEVISGEINKIENIIFVNSIELILKWIHAIDNNAVGAGSLVVKDKLANCVAAGSSMIVMEYISPQSF